MTHENSFWLALCLLFSSLSIQAAEHTQLKAFPAAQQGMLRYVIELTHKERSEEQGFSVELIVGKYMQTDGVNQIRLGSQIEPRPLKGWGYTYYDVKQESATISTMMAAPEGAPKVEQFVTTAPLSIRYNSRLPIVVYVPEGYEVRYRVWSAPDQYQAAGQG
ncbi:MAG: proteinase inhibitor I4 serpin [Proteobacteria bacterium]|nr:proteinase inhibitor I4 serpin [Pseudomonadota bacterium]